MSDYRSNCIHPTSTVFIRDSDPKKSEFAELAEKWQVEFLFAIEFQCLRVNLLFYEAPDHFTESLVLFRWVVESEARR